MIRNCPFNQKRDTSKQLYVVMVEILLGSILGVDFQEAMGAQCSPGCSKLN
jgi:hypothetical protein